MGLGMFVGWQLAIQGLRQHERIHSWFNDLALPGEDDREHALDLYWICQLTPPITGCLWTSPMLREGGNSHALCFSASDLEKIRSVIFSYTDNYYFFALYTLEMFFNLRIWYEFFPLINPYSISSEMSTGTDIICYFCLISYNCWCNFCCLIWNLFPTCCLNHYVVFGPSLFYMCPCGHVQLQLDTWLVAKIHRASLALSLPFIRKNTKWDISTV